MLAVLVETEELWQTVVFSAGAGIGVTVVFSIAIWGAARFIELNRGNRPVAAGGAAMVTLVGLAATFGAVALGIVVMTSN
jgi:hypothetical protein